MEFVALVLLGMWLHAIGSLVILPYKIVGMKRRSQGVRAFLTRRRLLVLGGPYLIVAPLVGPVILAIIGAGISDSNASGVSDMLEALGWLDLWAFLVASCFALSGALLWRRPDNSANATILLNLPRFGTHLERLQRLESCQSRLSSFGP